MNVYFMWEEKWKKDIVRILGSQNPHESREVSGEREKLHIGVPFNLMESLDHIILDEPNVNGNSYLLLLNNHFLPMLQELPQNKIFQEDKAPPPYTRAVSAFLDT